MISLVRGICVLSYKSIKFGRKSIRKGVYVTTIALALNNHRKVSTVLDTQFLGK